MRHADPSGPPVHGSAEPDPDRLGRRVGDQFLQDGFDLPANANASTLTIHRKPMALLNAAFRVASDELQFAASDFDADTRALHEWNDENIKQ
jgi:hypothetical protein